jgi:plasmid stabilization system protein ParE
VIVHLSERAEHQLLHAVGQLPAAAADELVGAYERGLLQLAQFPESGHRHRSIDARYRVLPVADWLAIYRYDGNVVRIITIVHGRADLASLDLDGER